ncbi:hypothetical protein LFE_0569 [Leptospirillum ferrooxidans C2-3]|uniref:Uncharacterized protein n=1 Tax=Leptospirillum ferrooxidans (strain C2-3) TaxID=1162668 RepID=I0ILY6_LEPFC|nr:hypothetical protein LFE_0569 [Leptospirillum ferrooxidans C2-3]
MSIRSFVLAELRHAQDRLPAHPDKASQPLGNGNAHRLHLLDQAGQTNPAFLKKSRVGRVGDVFFHRRGIHPHGRRDPLVLPELLPDERLDLLRSVRPQSFPELAQRGTLHKMGLFRRNATENHPHHVLVEPLNNLLIRLVEAVFQDHEADQSCASFENLLHRTPPGWNDSSNRRLSGGASRSTILTNALKGTIRGSGSSCARLVIGLGSAKKKPASSGKRPFQSTPIFMIRGWATRP